MPSPLPRHCTRAVAVAVAAIALALAAWTPPAPARQPAAKRCTPAAGFAAAEKLFAAINAGSPRRVLAAMTPPAAAGGPWFVRVAGVAGPVRDPVTLRSPDSQADVRQPATATLFFASSRQIARVIPLRHAAGEHLTVVAVRVGQTRAYGTNKVLEAAISVYYARSARDLPAAEWGNAGASKGMFSCAHSSISGLNAGDGPLAGPLQADAVGRTLCQGRHKAVKLSGRGWACH